MLLLPSLHNQLFWKYPHLRRYNTIICLVILAVGVGILWHASRPYNPAGESLELNKLFDKPRRSVEPYQPIILPDQI